MRETTLNEGDLVTVTDHNGLGMFKFQHGRVAGFDSAGSFFIRVSQTESWHYSFDTENVSWVRGHVTLRSKRGRALQAAQRLLR